MISARKIVSQTGSILALGTLLLFPALSKADHHQQQGTEAFLESIEEAHDLDSWYKQDLIAADITVNFGGKKRFAGTMIFDPFVSVSRFELDTGEKLVFDGEKAWVSPADSEYSNARFDLLTWPYFLAAPMKLTDPGTHHQMMKMQGEDVVKLTFGDNVGDAPDDWYIIYKDEESNQLECLAYIVTFFSGDKDLDKKEPHAVVYSEYKDFKGAQISHRWEFYNWSEEEGVYGELIGEATVHGIKSMDWDPALFEKPEDARESEHPQK